MSLDKLTRFSWTDDSGSGLDGTIINNTQLQNIFDAIDAALGQAVKVQGSAYTVLPTDDLLKVTGGTFTVNLYTAVNYDGRQLDVVNIGTGTVSLDGFGAQTIAGMAVFVVPPNHSIRIKSDGANWIIVSFSVAGVAWERLWVPVTGFRPWSAAGAAAWPETLSTTSGQEYVAAAFSPTVAQYMSMQFSFPRAWNRGTVQFQPVWTNLAGGVGDVVWVMGGNAMGDNETLDVGLGAGSFVTDTALAAQRFHIGARSPVMTIAGSPAFDDLVRLAVFRSPLDAADTYGSLAYLMGVVAWYQVNARSDD